MAIIFAGQATNGIPMNAPQRLDTQRISNYVSNMATVGPQGFWGSGENGYSFSGSWGALIIILGELGSKLIILGI